MFTLCVWVPRLRITPSPQSANPGWFWDSGPWCALLSAPGSWTLVGVGVPTCGLPMLSLEWRDSIHSDFLCTEVSSWWQSVSTFALMRWVSGKDLFFRFFSLWLLKTLVFIVLLLAVHSLPSSFLSFKIYLMPLRSDHGNLLCCHMLVHPNLSALGSHSCYISHCLLICTFAGLGGKLHCLYRESVSLVWSVVSRFLKPWKNSIPTCTLHAIPTRSRKSCCLFVDFQRALHTICLKYLIFP